MFLFFQVQALWAVMFALPVAAASLAPRPGLDAWDAAGLVVWLAAIGGEWLADRQLARFRADPANRGRVCRDGLWRWSRHPNYFFEWLHWPAYVLIGVGSAYWWVTLAGVVVMYVFLNYVTGVPFTEQQALRSRGEAYREYQRSTSRFFPLPPKT
jgi:steroid 5-alpha reductase family enzyme